MVSISQPLHLSLWIKSTKVMALAMGSVGSSPYWLQVQTRNSKPPPSNTHQQHKKPSKFPAKKPPPFWQKDAFPKSLPFHNKNPHAIYKDSLSKTSSNKHLPCLVNVLVRICILGMPCLEVVWYLVGDDIMMCFQLILKCRN